MHFTSLAGYNLIFLGKPTKTKQLRMTLRPKYSGHLIQLPTYVTKSNLLQMTLSPTKMSALLV